MSHARQADVFQTGVLPPTQADDDFLSRRSSLSELLTIQRTLGGGDPGERDREEEIPGLCNPRARGPEDIGTRVSYQRGSVRATTM